MSGTATGMYCPRSFAPSGPRQRQVVDEFPQRRTESPVGIGAEIVRQRPCVGQRCLQRFPNARIAGWDRRRDGGLGAFGALIERLEALRRLLPLLLRYGALPILGGALSRSLSLRRYDGAAGSLDAMARSVIRVLLRRRLACSPEEDSGCQRHYQQPHQHRQSVCVHPSHPFASSQLLRLRPDEGHWPGPHVLLAVAAHHLCCYRLDVSSMAGSAADERPVAEPTVRFSAGDAAFGLPCAGHSGSASPPRRSHAVHDGSFTRDALIGA